MKKKAQALALASETNGGRGNAMFISPFQPIAVKPKRADIASQAGLFPWIGTARGEVDPPAIAESSTSRAAARRVRGRVSTVRRRVLDALRAAGSVGRTDAELSAELGVAENTTRPRRVLLRAEGVVVDSGKRRATQTGSLAVVWVLTEVPR